MNCPLSHSHARRTTPRRPQLAALLRLVIIVGLVLLVPGAGRATPAPAASALPRPVAPLSPPHGWTRGATVLQRPGGFLTAPARGDPLAIARAFLQSHAADLGLTAADLADLVVKDRYTTAHNGLTHLYLRQRHAGIEVFNGDMNVSVTADGRILNLGSGLVSNLAATINTTQPLLAPADAVRAAGSYLGLPLARPLTVLAGARGPAQSTVVSDGGLAHDAIPARLMFEPLATGQVVLAWDLVLRLAASDHWLDLRVDAVHGTVLAANDWTVDEGARGAEIVAAPALPPEQLAASQPTAAQPLLTPNSYAVFPLPTEKSLADRAGHRGQPRRSGGGAVWLA